MRCVPSVRLHSHRASFAGAYCGSAFPASRSTQSLPHSVTDDKRKAAKTVCPDGPYTLSLRRDGAAGAWLGLCSRFKRRISRRRSRSIRRLGIG